MISRAVVLRCDVARFLTVNLIMNVSLQKRPNYRRRYGDSAILDKPFFLIFVRHFLLFNFMVDVMMTEPLALGQAAQRLPMPVLSAIFGSSNHIETVGSEDEDISEGSLNPGGGVCYQSDALTSCSRKNKSCQS